MFKFNPLLKLGLDDIGSTDIVIGSTVTGGTNNAVLFVDGSGLISTNANFTYIDPTLIAQQIAAFNASTQAYLYAFDTTLSDYVQIYHDGTNGYINAPTGHIIQTANQIYQPNIVSTGTTPMTQWIEQIATSGLGAGNFSMIQQDCQKDLASWLVANGLFQNITGDLWLGFHCNQDAASNKSTGIVQGIHGTSQVGRFIAYDGATSWIDRTFVYVTGSNPLHEVILNQNFSTSDPSAAGSSSGTTYTGKVWRILNSTTEQYFVNYRGDVSGRTYTSTVATGTSPLTVTSTTAVTNLNADLLDGYHVSTTGSAIPNLSFSNTWTAIQTMGTTTKFAWRDSDLYINSSADGVLDISADTTMNVAVTLTTLNVASGTVTTANLATGTITTLNLGTGSLTTANIATGATTANIGPQSDITIGGYGSVVVNELGADFDFRLEGDSLTHMIFCDASAATENIALLTGSAPNWQSMDGGIFIGNASTVPTGNPTSGGFLYVESGALKYRGTSGTITTIGPA